MTVTYPGRINVRIPKSIMEKLQSDSESKQQKTSETIRQILIKHYESERYDS